MGLVFAVAVAVAVAFAVAVAVAFAFAVAVNALLHPIFLGGSQNWRFHRQFWWGVRLILILIFALIFALAFALALALALAFAFALAFGFGFGFWLLAFGFWLLFYSPPLHLGGVKSVRADRLGLIWWGAFVFRF